MSYVGSRAKKPRKEVSQAISHEALLNKSRLYASRALQAKAAKDSEVYQIWAALALELVGKAQLASIHPCLVVEPENPNSLLEACGIETDTKVKTISAHVVFARLKHTVPNYGTPNAEACSRISSRRNAELHSGQVAVGGMSDKDWEGEFWSTSQLILSSMGMQLEDWVGSKSQVPLALVHEFRTIKIEAARQRVADSRTNFLARVGRKLGKKDWESLKKESENFHLYTYRPFFRYSLDDYWKIVCPACECIGFLGGDRVDEDVTDVDYESGYETVTCTYAPAEFYCPTCELHLEGAEDMEAAQFNEEYEDEIQREIAYEPEYGND